MKRLGNIGEVARCFIDATFPAGQASNLSYEGNVAYSYRTAIAMRNTGKGVLFITSRTYSNTTTQHCSLINRAAPLLRTIYVYDPTNPTSDESLDELLYRMDEQLTRATNTRVRRDNRIWALESAERLLADLTFLLEEFDPAWHTANLRLSRSIGEMYKVIGDLPSSTLDARFHFIHDRDTKHTQKTLDELIRIRAIAALEREGA